MLAGIESCVSVKFSVRVNVSVKAQIKVNTQPPDSPLDCYKLERIGVWLWLVLVGIKSCVSVRASVRVS